MSEMHRVESVVVVMEGVGQNQVCLPRARNKHPACLLCVPRPLIQRPGFSKPPLLGAQSVPFLPRGPQCGGSLCF